METRKTVYNKLSKSTKLELASEKVELSVADDAKKIITQVEKETSAGDKFLKTHNSNEKLVCVQLELSMAKLSILQKVCKCFQNHCFETFRTSFQILAMNDHMKCLPNLLSITTACSFA